MPFAPAPARAPIAEVAGDSSAAAALQELAGEMKRARDEGRMVADLPLDAVDEAYLVRDRMATDQAEFDVLLESIRARGQQTPIEVVALGDGRYGLISGWRRLSVLQVLHGLTGEDRFATVKALVRRPDTVADAYVAMVEENEIRIGLSYYERARIAAVSVKHGVYETEKEALLKLFSTASRAKRSKIRAFLVLFHAADDRLRFAPAINERLGVALARAIETDPGRVETLRAALGSLDARAAEEETACLEKVLKGFAAKPSPKGGSETKSEPAPSAAAEPAPGAAPAAEPAAAMPQGSGHVVPGITASWSGRTLTLSGPAVTEAFRQRLLDWIRDSR